MPFHQSVDVAALQERGWTQIPDIYLPDELLSLAMVLGHVVHQDSRAPISKLRPIPTEKAGLATASRIHGTGEFPFHTDLAHWPTPARFVVMGNTDVISNTPTLLLDTRTDKTFQEFRPLAKRAIWKVSMTRRPFMCSMLFSHGNTEGLRWDANVMSPSNSAADEIAEWLPAELPLSERDNVQPIYWDQTGRTLIVDNWRVLHARPAVPATDSTRTLQRIFVMEK